MEGEDDEVDIYISPRKLLAGQTPSAQAAHARAQEQSQAVHVETNKDGEQEAMDPKLTKVLHHPSLMGDGEPAYFYDFAKDGFNEKENGYREPEVRNRCELLYRVLLNGIYVILGLSLIALGGWTLSRSSTNFATYLRAEGRIIQHVEVLSGLLISAGFSIFLAGVFGMAKTLSRSYSRRRQKLLFFISEFFIFISVFLTACLLCVGALTLIHVNGNSDNLLVGRDGWVLNVHETPNDACNFETRFSCAGFSPNQCLASSSNTTLQAHCPGHFCVDQCKILTTNPNRQKMCNGCIEGSETYDFVICKTWEARNTVSNGCNTFIQNEVRWMFTAVIVLTSLVCVFTILSTVITGIRICARARP